MKGFTFRQRIGLLALLGGCGFLLLLSRLLLLQVFDHAHWVARAEGLRSGWYAVRPMRGAIVDASGQVLAHDAAGFELGVLALAWKSLRYECVHCGAAHFVEPGAEPPARCRRCRRQRDKPQVVLADERNLAPVARLLKVHVADLEARIENRVQKVEAQVERKLEGLRGRKRRAQSKELWFDYGRRPKRVRRDVPYEVAREVALNPRRNPAFHIQTSHSRLHPGGAAFAHMLGRVSESQTPVEVVRDDGTRRNMAAHAGRSGLELAFDTELRGAPGWVEMERDLKRRSREIVAERASTPGLTIQLTIDSRVQERAAFALHGAEGAFVVVNAVTGAVLAMATAPSYEPEHYASMLQVWIEREKLVGRSKLRGSPIPERACRSYHTPGSIMKPFTAVAALEAGDGAFDESITCERVFTYRGRRLESHHCNDLHGPLDMHGAIAISCNVYFQTLLARMLSNEHFPRFAEVGRRFGFGAPTGIEIEQPWTGRWSFEDARYPGVLIASAVGQGQVLVSPAQMARAYAGLATGKLPRLHLVARVGQRAVAPAPTDLGIDIDILRRVRAALRDVPTPRGSAPQYGLDRWRIACKTGTAQLAHRGYPVYNAWMAGFAPARGDRPAIAFAMVVLRSRDGGAHACGPRLAEFFRYFYREAGP